MKSWSDCGMASNLDRFKVCPSGKGSFDIVCVPPPKLVISSSNGLLQEDSADAFCSVLF